MAGRAKEAESRVVDALGRYRDRCDDLEFWASRECMVKASPFAGLGLGAQVRLRCNAPQRRTARLIDRMRREGGVVNGISLKTRKYGGSTLILSAIAREMCLTPNT